MLEMHKRLALQTCLKLPMSRVRSTFLELTRRCAPDQHKHPTMITLLISAMAYDRSRMTAVEYIAQYAMQKWRPFL